MKIILFGNSLLTILSKINYEDLGNPVRTLKLLHFPGDCNLLEQHRT